MDSFTSVLVPQKFPSSNLVLVGCGIKKKRRKKRRSGKRSSSTWMDFHFNWSAFICIQRYPNIHISVPTKLLFCRTTYPFTPRGKIQHAYSFNMHSYRKMKHWQEPHFLKSTNCTKRMLNMRKEHDQFFVCILLALQFLQLDDFYWLLLLLAFPQPCALQKLIYSSAYHVTCSVFFQPLPATKVVSSLSLSSSCR